MQVGNKVYYKLPITNVLTDMNYVHVLGATARYSSDERMKKFTPLMLQLPIQHYRDEWIILTVKTRREKRERKDAKKKKKKEKRYLCGCQSTQLSN